MAHSEATRRKISAGVLRAIASGKTGGKPFAKGFDVRRHRGHHGPGCVCPFCDTSKRDPRWRENLSVKMKVSNSRPERRAISSRAALARLAWEQREADRLVSEGYEVYVPSWVCDRIAVRDGKIYLVEFKQPGQPLRPKQQEVRDVEPDRYVVTYSKMNDGSIAKLDNAADS